MTTGRIWTQDEIKHLLQTNRTMVLRSCVKLYERQTRDEQEQFETVEANGIGFNSADACFMSDIAKQIIKGRKLSQKQFDITKKKIQKYSKQLTKIANGLL